MTRLRALGPCAVALALATVRPPAAAAQGYQPLAERSLLTTDARDERAVWVNPAGLSRRVEASLAADLTGERAGGRFEVSQYGLAVASRNVGFGWKHDRYPGGSGTNTYVVGVGLGDDLFSGGFAHRWNQGGQGSWDVGLRGRASPTLDVSVVWRNIGSPLVRDTVFQDSFVPAAALRLLDGRLLTGVEGDVSTGLGALREVRAGVTLAILPQLLLSCRGTFSGTAARRGYVVLVEFGAPSYRGTLAALLPSGGGIGAVGATGALVGDLSGPARR